MSNYRHGMKKTALYGVWSAMRSRCNNPNVAAYKNYGGRGIAVCERWNDFIAFAKDMGAPAKGQTLDRIDNNKGYSPENCRWVDRKTQGRNKRNTRILEIEGVQKSMAEWSEISGIRLPTIWKRLKDGWSNKDAVFIPKISKRAGVKRGEPIHQYAFGAERGVQFTEVYHEF